jgi:hypothetical protein
MATTATQPPAAIAATSSFTATIIALTAATVALATAFAVTTAAFAVALAACAAFCAAFADACAAFAWPWRCLRSFDGSLRVCSAVLTVFCVVFTEPVQS